MLARLTSRLPKRDSGTRKTHNNTPSSCASRLPPEILLCIFGYLQRYPLDWRTEILRNRLPEHISKTRNDLRAAYLVCRAWRDCAAPLLYSGVYLRTARQLFALLRTLNHWPASSALIRSIRLPDEDLPENSPVSQLFYPRKRRLRNIGRAVETLLEQCSQTTTIVFCVNTRNMAFIRGFYETAAQLERVEFAAGQHITSIFRDPLRPRFPRGSLLADPIMKHLKLRELFLWPTEDLHFPQLRSLHIYFCVSQPGWLRTILEHSPNLEVLYLEKFYVSEIIHWDVDELRAGAPSLRELRFDWTQSDIGSGFGFLARLTVLEISLRCLTQGAIEFSLPPTLETLILSSRGVIPSSGNPRNKLLTAVANVKRRLHGWKLHDTPRLATLRLTGDFMEWRLLQHWAMVSFLFGPYCRRLDVNLEVSLFCRNV
ncbi:hypothetical protein EXIGLDRAFT_729417 [Exidia glandulosa HHB12029]|uniref:F-box domain-containing protein n=1 Tax=Exidia glandulosa HHB12029 TaxID=1314781 RepID=A0A166B4U2_EXIGL|nr:hypothetical protein EXIGLDRAFT_729417 [Exidia glandulosa HHB12029]